jgi:hypothetical protein
MAHSKFPAVDFIGQGEGEGEGEGGTTLYGKSV